MNEVPRVPIHRAPLLVASWLVHWAFWPVLTWVALSLWLPLGRLVGVVAGGWLLLLLYLAVRSHFVALRLDDDSLVCIGFFRTVKVARSDIVSASSSNVTPPLAVVIFAPKMTNRSPYWTPELVLSSRAVLPLDAMFGPHRYVEGTVRAIREWIDATGLDAKPS